jgi:hypothetical protein
MNSSVTFEKPFRFTRGFAYRQSPTNDNKDGTSAAQDGLTDFQVGGEYSSTAVAEAVKKLQYVLVHPVLVYELAQRAHKRSQDAPAAQELPVYEPDEDMGILGDFEKRRVGKAPSPMSLLHLLPTADSGTADDKRSGLRKGSHVQLDPDQDSDLVQFAHHLGISTCEEHLNGTLTCAPPCVHLECSCQH